MSLDFKNYKAIISKNSTALIQTHRLQMNTIQSRNKPLHLQLINFLTREPRQFKGEIKEFL